MLLPVRKAVKLHDGALQIRVSDSIVKFSALTNNIQQGWAFFDTTYMTEGLKTLLRMTTIRLAGGSTNSSFHLKQAMGGGKTHSIAAAVYIARHPELRHKILPDLTKDYDYDDIRFAAFNGREFKDANGHQIEDLWKRIIRDLGGQNVPGAMSDIPPDETTWIKVFRNHTTPVLIVLDELPPYFAALNTIPAGNGTKADQAAVAFASMLSAAHRMNNVCVIVSDLEAAWEDGTEILDRALRNASLELERQEVLITPVDLQGDEVYQILRKRLIKEMPPFQVIDDVAAAYESVLKQKAKAGLVRKDVDGVRRAIHASYPFHPEMKHLIAMFKENPRFRQTRGLMELASMLLKSVWDTANDTLLVGTQHFNLSDPEVQNRLADMTGLVTAMTRDLYESNLRATAQVIDASNNNTAASEVGLLALLASTMADKDGTRGLRIVDMMTSLTQPNSHGQQYENAIEEMHKNATYFHIDGKTGRYFFTNSPNLSTTLKELAINIDIELITKEINHRIRLLFEPARDDAYSQVFPISEGVDNMAINKVAAGERLLVVTFPDGRFPPSAIKKYFDNSNLINKNAFLFLTGQYVAHIKTVRDLASLRLAARTLLAQIGKDHPDRTTIEASEAEYTEKLYAALAMMFDRLYYPFAPRGGTPVLREVSLTLPTPGGKRTPEDAIVDALKGAKKLFTDIDGADFDTIRAKVESSSITWGAGDEVNFKDVERRAAENASMMWLPPGGLEKLRQTAVKRGLWEELENDRVSKVVKPRVPSVVVSTLKMPTATDHEAVLEVGTQNASAAASVHFAENRPATEADPVVKGGQLVTSAVTVGFLVVDPVLGGNPKVAPGHDRSGTRWSSTLPVAHELVDVPGGGRTVRLVAHPDVQLRYTLDGSGARDNGMAYVGPFEVGNTAGKVLYYVKVTVGNTFDMDRQGDFTIPARNAGGTLDPWEGVDFTKPARLVKTQGGRFEIGDTAKVWAAVDVMRKSDVALRGVDIIMNVGEESGGARRMVQTRLDNISVNGTTLYAVLESIASAVGKASGITVKFNSAEGSNYSFVKDLSGLLQQPLVYGEVKQ